MSRCCLIFMPILILLQGIVYLGLSIWGLVMRQCSNEIISLCTNPFGFVMDLVYFFDETCGNPNVIVAGHLNPVTLNETNFAEPTINRTQAFLISYLVVSALWIVFSMFIISSLSCTKSKTYKIYSFILWFAVVIAGCILDAVATGYHIHDVVHTTSADNTFSYLGITATEDIMSLIRCYDGYFVVPSIVMTAISSRALVIWFINLFGSFYCVKALNIYLNEDGISNSTAVLVMEDQNQPNSRK